MKAIDIFWALILVIGLSLAFYFNYQESSALKRCSAITLGKVTKKYRIRKKGEYVACNYEVAGKEYSRSYKLVELPMDRRRIFAGDTIPVRYACEDPSLSTLSPE